MIVIPIPKPRLLSVTTALRLDKYGNVFILLLLYPWLCGSSSGFAHMRPIPLVGIYLLFPSVFVLLPANPITIRTNMEHFLAGVDR